MFGCVRLRKLFWVVAQAVKVVYIVKLFEAISECSICTRRFFVFGLLFEVFSLFTSFQVVVGNPRCFCRLGCCKHFLLIDSSCY